MADVHELKKQLETLGVSRAWVDEYLTDPKTGKAYDAPTQKEYLATLLNRIQVYSGSIEAQRKAVDLYASQSTLNELQKAIQSGAAPVEAVKKYFDTLKAEADQILAKAQSDAASKTIADVTGWSAEELEHKKFDEILDQIWTKVGKNAFAVDEALGKAILSMAQARSADAEAKAKIQQSLAQSALVTELKRLKAEGKATGAIESFLYELAEKGGRAAGGEAESENYLAALEKVKNGNATGAEMKLVRGVQQTEAGIRQANTTSDLNELNAQQTAMQNQILRDAMPMVEGILHGGGGGGLSGPRGAGLFGNLAGYAGQGAGVPCPPDMRVVPGTQGAPRLPHGHQPNGPPAHDPFTMIAKGEYGGGRAGLKAGAGTPVVPADDIQSMRKLAVAEAAKYGINVPPELGGG